jgi:hypothetical protein
MNELFLTICIVLLCTQIFGFWYFTIEIKELNRKNKDLELNFKQRIIENKNSFDDKLKTATEEAKSHADKAMIALSKRIGKREKPTE